MVGNDVVDLVCRGSDARAPHPRFDQRVFGDGERREIARSGDPDRTRWSLWAAKEAAYKAARRVDARVVWSPIRFAVELGPEADRGRVDHASGGYRVRFVPAASGVHAVAVAETLGDLLDSAGAKDAGLLFGCRRAPVEDASAEVRQLARRGLAGRLLAPPEEIEVRRVERIPQLWCRGLPLQAPLSLSHHGDLVAWACLIEAHGSPA